MELKRKTRISARINSLSQKILNSNMRFYGIIILNFRQQFRKQMRMKQILILLINIITTITTPTTINSNIQCPVLIRDPNTPITNFYSGLSKIQQKDQTKLTSTLLVNQQLIKLETTLLCNVIYIQDYYDDSMIQFRVIPLITSGRAQVEFKVSPTAKWKSVYINFIVSNLDFAKATFFTVGNQLLSKGRGNRDVDVTYDVDDKTKSIGKNNMGIQSFISGVEYRRSPVKIGIKKSVFDDKVIKVTLSIQNQTEAITIIYISLFIFKRSTELDPVQLKEVQFFNTIQVQIFPKANTEQQVFKLMGFVDIFSNLLQNLAQSKKRLLQKVKLQFFKIFRPRGFAFNRGNQSQLAALVGFGDVTDPICFSQQQCRKLGGIWLSSKLTNLMICADCRKNTVFDYKTQTCKCKPQHYQINGECKSLESYCMQKGLFYFNYSCYGYEQKIELPSIQRQEPPQILIGSKVQTQSKIQQIQKQKSYCPENFSYYGGDIGCQCTQGYYSYKTKENQSKCVKPCSPDLYWNATLQQCVCISGKYYQNDSCKYCEDFNAQWIQDQEGNGQCLCKNNTFLLYQKCQQCSSINAVYNYTQRSCKCISQYYGTGVVCRKINNRQQLVQNNQNFFQSLYRYPKDKFIE